MVTHHDLHSCTLVEQNSISAKQFFLKETHKYFQTNQFAVLEKMFFCSISRKDQVTFSHNLRPPQALSVHGGRAKTSNTASKQWREDETQRITTTTGSIILW
jgi:hypothetical protein